MRRLCLVLALSFAVPAIQCGHPETLPGESDEAAKTAPAKPPPAPAPTQAPAQVEAATAVKVPIDGLPSFGNPTALVTLVAFTDYECPYCAKADKTIAALRAEVG